MKKKGRHPVSEQSLPTQSYRRNCTQKGASQESTTKRSLTARLPKGYNLPNNAYSLEEYFLD